MGASAPFHNGHPRVVGIKQIKNETLSRQHQQYREYLANKHGEEPTSQELYHGTNCNILDIIYKDGIRPPSDMEANDCRYCTGKHDWKKCHMYGLGIYLADMAAKSNR